MEERKFVRIGKEEFGVKEFIKKEFGKGKISGVRIDYTPVGEKITIATHKPGLVIGKKGESIERLTAILKKRFSMENPHIDISEILNPDLDAQIVADEIALSLERFGSMRYKSIAYRMLGRIKKAGAIGAELRLSGKLPSDRSRSWRFAFGYLKKTGGSRDVVDRAMTTACDNLGMVGIKVSILSPNVYIGESGEVSEEILNKIQENKSEKQDGKGNKK